MPQISKFVRDSIREQLAAETTGLNDRVAALATAYGIEAYRIDWGNESQNFLFGRIEPARVEESSPFIYPLLTIDTVRAQNTNRVKFATFSGQVIGVIEVHHSWLNPAVLADFASLVDATEDAVISTLNDQNAIWRGLEWNGQVSTQRGPIRDAGYHWLQTLTFFCNFNLSV